MRKPVVAFGGAITGGSRVSDVDRAITRTFRTWCSAILCWAGFGSTPVLAGEFAYGAGYSLVYDSNIKGVSSGAVDANGVPIREVAEFTQTLLSGFAYQERTANLTARLLAQVEWHDYLRNTYTPDKSFFVDGAGVWTILPKQFTWSMADAARQVRIDIAAPDTPSNRTNVNSLSTGPDFTFRLDPANAAAIGARYGRFDTATGVGDSDRHSANARLLHSVSAQTTVSATYEATRVYFKDPAFTQILQENRFLSYAMLAPPSSMTIDAGATRVLREGAGELKSRLARITAAYQVNSASTLQGSLVDQVSDTGSDLIQGATSASLSTGAGALPSAQAPVVAVADVYRSKRGELANVNQGGRFGFTLRGYVRSIDYQNLPQDFNERGGRLEGSYLYSGSTRFRVYADYLRRIFRNSPPDPSSLIGASIVPLNQQDTERTAGVGVTFRLTHNLNVTVEGARFERTSTALLGNSVDWRATLLIGYSTGPLYTVQSRR